MKMSGDLGRWAGLERRFSFSRVLFTGGLILGAFVIGGARAGASLSAPAPVAAAPADANDLLVLHFDDSFVGENGETAAQSAGANFVTGVLGSAVSLPAGNVLTYPSAGNIDASEGTVEFWIKPAWNGSDFSTINIFSWGVAGGLLLKKDPSTLGFSLNLFNAGGQPEIRAWPNISNWQANQWRHVACTWSNSNKKAKVYIDGQLKSETAFAMTLPAIANATFRIGGFTTAGPGDNIGAIDELRVSGVARTAQEIAQRYLASLTVTSLTLEPESLHLFPGWFWTPKLMAVTNQGTMQIPATGAAWTSTNPAVAAVGADGRINCLAPGTVTLTANVQGRQDTMSLLVKAPVLQPEIGPVPPSLATPAPNSLHEVPVVILRYLPTADGVNIDPAYDSEFYSLGQLPLSQMKSQIDAFDRRMKFMLEEGSRFRGYNNPAAKPSLGYKVVQYITVYEPTPPGLIVGTSQGFPLYEPDWFQIFARFNLQHYIDTLGVKEIWFWMGNIQPNFPSYNPGIHRPENFRGGWESNMSSPTTGDISNSNRNNADLPIYSRTYTVYSQNNRRTQAEAMHNHGHQLESILSHVNQLRDGNTTLWWQQFAKPVAAGANPPARCGNTHFPPNATQDYDYTNMNLVASDIMNWQPSGGPTTMVNANTWGNVPYAWPGGILPPQRVESHWYIFWFQSMAGWGNAIPYNTNKMTNWWAFTGDWDAAIQGGLGLHEPGNCAYGLSATSRSVSAAGASESVTVTCPGGCKWIGSSNEPWITVTSGRTGNGNGAVNFTVAANAGNARTGTIAIAGQVFTITQGSGCAVSLDPASQNAPAVASSSSFAVTAASSCAWNALSSAPWIILSNGSGTGSGSVGFMVAANPGPARSGTIDVNGQLFTINQANGCAFTLTPASQTVAAGGAAHSVTVTASDRACAWTALSNAPWITVNSGASGTGGGTVNYTVPANAGPVRSGTMTIAGQTFSVNQESNCPAITLTPESLPAGAIGANYSQTLTASGGAGGYNFTITSGAPPAGVALAPGGQLSGMPTAAGVFTFTVTATDAGTCTGARSYTLFVAGEGLQFYPLARPVRLLDTRAGASPNACHQPNAQIPGGTARTQPARGACEGLTIPSNAKAITGNITTVQSGGGFLTLYPSDASRPTVANSNYGANEILNNVFTVGLGEADGAFKVYVTTDTDVVIDVTGYYAPPGTGGLYFHPLPRPVRLLDTRAGSTACHAPVAPLPGATETSQQATGDCAGLQIPANAKAIVGNATTVDPIGTGYQYFTLYPADASRPFVASSNYQAGQIMNGPFTVGLSSSGAFKIYPTTQTELVIDVSGYYSADATDGNGAGLLFYPLPRPVRLLETRPGFNGCYTPGGELPALSTRLQAARGICGGMGVAMDALGIIGNATVVQPLADGWLTFFPSDATKPTVAQSNYAAGQVFNRHFIVGLGNADGAFNIFTKAATHLVIDLSGYFAP